MMRLLSKQLFTQCTWITSINDILSREFEFEVLTTFFHLVYNLCPNWFLFVINLFLVPFLFIFTFLYKSNRGAKFPASVASLDNLCFYSFILKFFSYLYIWCCHTRGATFSARAVALSAIYGQSDQDLSAPGGDELVAKEKTRIKVPPAKCYFADII